ncbi:MAG: hypothetical protein HAW59_03730 [Betaproteobacteria bacterium]|nr:hypothetical protein [Betaproteobacteria bacterium]
MFHAIGGDMLKLSGIKLLLAPLFLAASLVFQSASAYGAVWSYGPANWTKHDAYHHRGEGTRLFPGDLRWKMNIGVGGVGLPTEQAARREAENACKKARGDSRARCRIEIFRNRCAAVSRAAILSGERHQNKFLAAFGASQKRVRRAHLYQSLSSEGKKWAKSQREVENQVRRRCNDLKSSYNRYEQRATQCKIESKCDTRP